MVRADELTAYSKASPLVKRYAIGMDLLSSRIPETDVVFTAPMIIVLDALIRQGERAYTVEDLSAGTGLEEDVVKETLEECQGHGFIVEVEGGFKLDRSDEIVKILIEEQDNI